MSHAFTKDSRACAACVSWAGTRALSADNTLVEVAGYQAEGACRSPVSPDYRQVKRAGHTCPVWASMPTLKAHGAMPNNVRSVAAPARTPTVPGVSPVPVPPPVVVQPARPVAPQTAPTSTPLDVDHAPLPAQALHGYWRRSRHDRRIPAARDIETPLVRDAVARLCLLRRSGDDFIYLACGRAVAKRMTRRPIRETLAGCHAPVEAERLRAESSACLATGEPRCLMVRDDPILPGARFAELYLPLLDETDVASLVLVYRHLPGG